MAVNSSNVSYAYRRDIPWNFNLDDNGDLKMLLDIDAINQSIKTILVTDIGCIPMEPLRGTALQSLLGENALPSGFLEYELADRITKAIEKQEPLVKTSQIKVNTSNINNYEVTVLIEYLLADNVTRGVFEETLSITQIGTPIKSS